MKRNIIIVLFLPLFYTQMGYYGQFIVLQWRLKEAAREAWIATLPDAAFVRIDQAAVDARGHWEERGKECRFNGHMYDVIRARTTGGTTWLYCLDDENEERLDRQSESVTRANQDNPDKRTGHSLCLSIGDIYCESPGWTMPSPGPVLRRYYDGGVRPLPGRYREITGPPPRI